MREPTLPTYPEELSQFLMAQAALLDAQPANTMKVSTDSPAIKPMPPEFQLMRPRRVRWSGSFEQPNGDMPHFIGFSDATPEQEAWHRIHEPEGGLHPDDLTAYRKSQRGPVAKFFGRLKIWPSNSPL